MWLLEMLLLFPNWNFFGSTFIKFKKWDGYITDCQDLLSIKKKALEEIIEANSWQQLQKRKIQKPLVSIWWN